MGILRTAAWLFLLVAVIVFTADLTQSANGSAPASSSLLSHWKTTSPGTLAASAAFVQRYTHPKLWDPVLLRVLLLPAWLLIGTLGLVLGLLSRRKRRVNIFAN